MEQKKYLKWYNKIGYILANQAERGKSKRETSQRKENGKRKSIRRFP